VEVETIVERSSPPVGGKDRLIPPQIPSTQQGGDQGFRPTGDIPSFQRFVFEDNIGTRLRVLEFMTSDAIFKPVFGLSLAEQRALTLERLKRFGRRGFIDCMDVVKNPKRFAAVMECLHLVDYSLSIKGGVHFTLCGGTIAKLGTKKHHEKYLDKINQVQWPGCFAMTELAHGSNVMAIETTAEYDASSQEFIIHTPHDAASKFWIGGAAQHAMISTVFAQLYISGKWLGVHVFIVHLRDEHGHVLSNIRIEDNGPKMGLNGVDNGRIWFQRVRVPLDALLDKYCSVSPDGTYSSALSTIPQRFGVMVGGLTTGRILIAQAAVDASKLALTIAFKYSTKRRQFGEKLIIDYLSHQRRLVPSLAETFAYHFAMMDLMRLVQSKSSPKQEHTLSSGLKAAATWTKTEILQRCRECCGGMGFLAVNQIGPMICDMNVDVTFEGDNSVLMQQVVKGMLKEGLSNVGIKKPSLDDQSVIDEVAIQELLITRQRVLTAKLGRKIQAATCQGISAEQAFDDNLDLVLSLGWAFVEAHVMKIFHERVSSAGEGFRRPLGLLCHLYGLSRIENDAAFFLTHGLLPPSSTEVVHAQSNDLCRRLSHNAGKTLLSLCEGFAIPSYFITAPIATDAEHFPSTATINLAKL